MIGLPDPIHDDLERRASAELGYRVIAWSELPLGTNNRLFRLETDAGMLLLAKVYRQDQWNRLEREFATLAFLRRQGFTTVPTPHIRGDAFAYAVYLYEEGSTRPAGAMTDDHLWAAAVFAAELHRLRPGRAERGLPLAIEVKHALADPIRGSEARIGALEEVATRPDAPDLLRTCAREVDLGARVRDLIATATAGLSVEELGRPIPATSRWLNTGDFGVQNLLLREDGGVAVVDFEWAGWDDPARLGMGFVAHGGSEGLSKAGLDVFLVAYAAARSLPRREAERFERVGILPDIEWVAIYASALSGTHRATRQFAIGETDPHVALLPIVEKLKARLRCAAVGAGYHFPAWT